VFAGRSCAGAFDHRRAWVEDHMQMLCRVFAVEIASYAVMSNHLHVIARMKLDAPALWSATDVARRWFAVYPAAYFTDGTPKPASDAQVAAKSDDVAWVAVRRIAKPGHAPDERSAARQPAARRPRREKPAVGLAFVVHAVRALLGASHFHQKPTPSPATSVVGLVHQRQVVIDGEH